MRRVISIILQVLIGAAFFISALSKIPTLEVFGWTIAETNWVNWSSAEWIARLIIGLEFIIGLCFLAQIGINRMARPLAFISLALFTLYLFFVLVHYGNESNCGCYGEWLPMSTKESIVKNVVLGVLLLLNMFFYFELSFKWDKALLAFILIASVCTPFIKEPPSNFYIMGENKFEKEPFNLSIIKEYTPQNKDFIKDKMIVAIVSPGCKYCRKAGRRIRIMKQRNPSIPFLFVFGGSGKGIDDFMLDTKAQNIPYILIGKKEPFYEINGRAAVPTIKWIEKNSCIKESNYLNLKEKEILEWLQE